MTAIVRVQGNARGESPSGNTIAITMADTPANGNFLVLITGAYGGTEGQTENVTEIIQTGVIWTKKLQKNHSANGRECLEVWLGIVGAGASKNITVTYQYDFTGDYRSVADVCEYSSDTILALDKFATNEGVYIYTTGTTIITTDPNELWIGALLAFSDSDNTQSSPLNGFTLLDGAAATIGTYGYESLSFLEKIVSSTGTAGSGTTPAAGSSCIGLMVTFGGPHGNYDVDTVFKKLVPTTYSIDTDIELSTPHTTGYSVDAEITGSPLPPPSITETLLLSNSSGQLWCKPISWYEKQECNPAIRNIPYANSQYLDDGTWVLRPRTLDFVIRLSDKEKKTFMAMYEYALTTNTYTDLYLHYNDSEYVWHYLAWIQTPTMKWEYSMEYGKHVRWWDVRVTCNVLYYSTDANPIKEWILNGNFERGNLSEWIVYDGIISSSNPHAGTYCATVDSYDSLDMYHPLTSAIPIDSITSLKVWIRTDTTDISVYFEISGGSSFYATIPIRNITNAWAEYDLLSILKDYGKYGKLSAIEIYNGTPSTVFSIDDCTLIAPVPPTELSYSLSTVTIDGHTLDFILDYERKEKKITMLPEWINQFEAVDSYFWNKELTEILYTYLATNEEKYLMDTTLRNHHKVVYEDYIHNLFSTQNGGVWVSSVDSQYDAKNWVKPWKITVTIKAMKDELESRTASVYVDSFAYPNGTNHLGTLYLDEGTASLGLPSANTLDVGIHILYFNLPDEATSFSRWQLFGGYVILDEQTFNRESILTVLITGNCSIYAIYNFEGIVPLSPPFVLSINARNSDTTHTPPWDLGIVLTAKGVPTDCIDDHPTITEELIFGYKVVILGSLQSHILSSDEIIVLTNFVSAGGVLIILCDTDYGNSPPHGLDFTTDTFGFTFGDQVSEAIIPASGYESDPFWTNLTNMQLLFDGRIVSYTEGEVIGKTITNNYDAIWRRNYGAGKVYAMGQDCIFFFMDGPTPSVFFAWVVGA